MNTVSSDYPASDLRVCDADRDRALCELTQAFQVGRITAGEFDERSEQALGARTGKDLTVLVADLPRDSDRAGTSAFRHAHHKIAAWTVVSASAAAAIPLAAVALTNALSHPVAKHYDRALAREILASMGLKVRLPPPPPPPGFDWVGTMTPAAVAVLLVAVIVVVLRIALAPAGASNAHHVASFHCDVTS
jgi:Domain of unknown function (DUF1707)